MSGSDTCEITTELTLGDKSTSTSSIILPEFKLSMKIADWITMTREILSPFECDTKNKKTLLMTKLPEKYQTVVMTNFSKSIDELLKIIQNTINDEPIEIQPLYEVFNFNLHNPKEFVDQKLKIMAKLNFNEKFILFKSQSRIFESDTYA